MTDNATEMFLIEKRGLYYRPNAQGYTGRKADAGRYTFEEAASRAGPNGPDGSQDGMGIWRESEAPEHSSACPWDVKMKDAAFKDGYELGRKECLDLYTAVCAERDALKVSLENAQTDFTEQLGRAESLTFNVIDQKSRAEAAEAERDALDKACVKWSEVSQRNYQHAKAAEAEVARLREALSEIATDEHPLGWIAIAALQEKPHD